MVENCFDLINKFKEVYHTIVWNDKLPVSVIIDDTEHTFNSSGTVSTDNYFFSITGNVIFLNHNKTNLFLHYDSLSKIFGVMKNTTRIILGNLETGILKNIYFSDDYETDLSKWSEEFLFYAKLKGWL